MLRVTAVFFRRGCGIVGLPNVGKSTLFNAMTSSQLAKTGNFPFCTINANLAKVDVYDERLRELAKFTHAEKIVDVEIDLADVAGLIEGAHKGEGMGNKFLADIRPCNVILQMVRCFESAKDGFDRPDPLSDIVTISNELVFADLDALDKRLNKSAKLRKDGDEEVAVLKKAHAWLSEGKSARDLRPKLKYTEVDHLDSFQLLSNKPILYVLNVDDQSMKNGNEFSKIVEDKFGEANTVKVCSVVEEQTSQFSRPERLAFLAEYGVEKPAVEILLQKVFAMLKLQSFFTVGPKMAKAWSIPQGSKAQDAAGEIHTDFKKHFLYAKVSDWSNFIKNKNLKEAEAAMKKVDEDYVMKDGECFIVEHRAEKK